MAVMAIVDHAAMMRGAIAKCANDAKWLDAPFEGIKVLSNSHVGKVGQEFVEELCKTIGLSHEFPMLGPKRNPHSPWDMKILGHSFELKTATEDVSRNFQFNHIRHHRPYDGVICLGIGPSYILFGCYTKADIATGKAGRLVTMDQGSSATFKLTKSRTGLFPIVEFEPRLRAIQFS